MKRMAPLVAQTSVCVPCVWVFSNQTQKSPETPKENPHRLKSVLLKPACYKNLAFASTTTRRITGQMSAAPDLSRWQPEETQSSRPHKTAYRTRHPALR